MILAGDGNDASGLSLQNVLFVQKIKQVRIAQVIDRKHGLKPLLGEFNAGKHGSSIANEHVHFFILQRFLHILHKLVNFAHVAQIQIERVNFPRPTHCLSLSPVQCTCSRCAIENVISQLCLVASSAGHNKLGTMSK